MYLPQLRLTATGQRPLPFFAIVAGLGLQAACSETQMKHDPAQQAGKNAESSNEEAELRRNIEATENLVERRHLPHQPTGAAANK